MEGRLRSNTVPRATPTEDFLPSRRRSSRRGDRDTARGRRGARRRDRTGGACLARQALLPARDARRGTKDLRVARGQLRIRTDGPVLPGEAGPATRRFRPGLRHPQARGPRRRFSRLDVRVRRVRGYAVRLFTPVPAVWGVGSTGARHRARDQARRRERASPADRVAGNSDTSIPSPENGEGCLAISNSRYRAAGALPPLRPRRRLRALGAPALPHLCRATRPACGASRLAAHRDRGGSRGVSPRGARSVVGARAQVRGVSARWPGPGRSDGRPPRGGGVARAERRAGARRPALATALATGTRSGADAGQGRRASSGIAALGAGAAKDPPHAPAGRPRRGRPRAQSRVGLRRGPVRAGADPRRERAPDRRRRDHGLDGSRGGHGIDRGGRPRSASLRRGGRGTG